MLDRDPVAAFRLDDRVVVLTGRTPVGWGGDEHELDGALLFLADDASSFVTGQVLAVDGRWTAI